MPEARLVVFSGLPGVGKSTLARPLARRLGACWLRIDSLEHALVDAGPFSTADLGGAGYRAACALAEDNLENGLSVVADLVNPFEFTRAWWRAAAERAGAPCREVEVVCSDPAEHRRRVESRAAAPARGAPGPVPPDWRAVAEREYHPWTRARLVVDTARLAPDAAVDYLERNLVP